MGLDWQARFGLWWLLFKNLDLLLSSGDREPLKFSEPRNDSITLCLEGPR